MQRAQLTEFVFKLDREERSIRGPLPLVKEPQLLVNTSAKESRQTSGLGSIGAGLLTLAFLLLIGLSWTRPDFNRPGVADWKPFLASAEAARTSGDLYGAQSLYLQAGRVATWSDDWAGLIAAGCGLNQLRGAHSPYSTVNMLLLRAMALAERQQNPSGLVAVASAFAGLGEANLVSAVWSRLPAGWAEGTDESADWISAGCWGD